MVLISLSYKFQSHHKYQMLQNPPRRVSPTHCCLKCLKITHVQSHRGAGAVKIKWKKIRSSQSRDEAPTTSDSVSGAVGNDDSRLPEGNSPAQEEEFTLGVR
jgi:hypothetical protein